MVSRSPTAPPAARSSDTSLIGSIEATRERQHLGLSRREWAIDGGSAVLFLVSALVLCAVNADSGSVDWIATALVVGVLAVLSRVDYEVGLGYAMPTQLAFIPLLFVAPAGLVPLLVASSFVLSALICDGNRARGVVLSISSSWFSLGPAIVFSLTGPLRLSVETAFVLAAAFATQVAADYVNWTLHESVSAGTFRLAPTSEAFWLYRFDAMLTPLGIGTAVLLRESLWALAIPLPIIVLLRAVQKERRERFDQALQLAATYRKTALLLGGIVEADDVSTGVHSLGVVRLSAAVAGELGVGEQGMRELEYAALLHDIGKIKIPKSILHKQGPLDAAEWVVMRTHAALGAEMLESVGGMLAEIAPIVRHHHERWDGSGYPSGLAADAIPLHSRIISCCDTFSAITSDRPYRVAGSVEEAMAEIERVSGSQLDANVVEALCRVLGAPRLARAA